MGRDQGIEPGATRTVQPTALQDIAGKASDFVNNQMPTQLDHVSVTVNGKNAFVYYISPTQVNILTPPDMISGSVQVVVTNNGAASATFTAQAQAISPSFFVFDGTHVIGVHLAGGDVGPTTLYPGLTTPAKPNEIDRAVRQRLRTHIDTGGERSRDAVTEACHHMPVIKIGGIPAQVQFAGLAYDPGEFQFNVVVPPDATDGDLPIVATYNGLTTQPGALITIQH